MTTLPSHPALLSGSKIKISNIKMKKINDTITAYDKGVISKPDFIKEMHEMHHTKLFEYARHLPKTNIKKIEIQDDQIIMTSRDLGVRMLCNSKDHRLSPIEVLNFLEYEKRIAAIHIPFNLLSTLNSSEPRQNACFLGEERLTQSFINIAMVALTLDYKKDQIHLDEILKRLN